MAKPKKAAPQARQEMTGLERLSLRVSSMINHPIAQSQRWVTIHRLDTDGEMEWEEVMGLLSETPYAIHKPHLPNSGLTAYRG
ncbi:DUF1654 domain-containing protein, partial [Pseudomonas sp.]